MHSHPQTVQAVGTPGAKYPDIAAAMASPHIRSVATLMRRAGLDTMTVPLSVHEIDAKLAASKALDTPRDRIALKAALSTAGLMKD